MTKTLHVDCPDCDTTLPVEVFAEVDGKADDGTLQVSVFGDKLEVESHALVCEGR
jgi:hypothetical protein